MRNDQIGRCFALSAIALSAFVGARDSSAVPQSLRRAPISFCVDSNGFANNSLTIFRDLATTSDARKAAIRNQSSLSATTQDSVQLVTSSPICQRAAESIRRSRYQADTGVLMTMLLLKYGSTRYVALDGKMGEWICWIVFDTTFRIVGNFTM